MSAFGNKCSWLPCPNALTIRTAEKMSHEVFRPSKFARQQFCSSACCTKWMEVRDAETARQKSNEERLARYFIRTPAADTRQLVLAFPHRGSG